jgi:hypothetical protein
VSENVEHEMPSQMNPTGAFEPSAVQTEPIPVAAPTASDQAQDREVEALQSLYRQAVHLQEPEPEYQPESPITRMTHHQLQAMRAKTGTETEIKVPFKETVASFIIRSFDEFKQSFKKSGSPRRAKCLDVGHECIHCGKQFAVEYKKDKDKDK